MEITPAGRVRQLAPLVGRWRTFGTVFGEDGAPVMSVDGTDEYEWMPGGQWVIHRVDVAMGNDRARALELIGEPADDGTFAMRAFDSSGSFDEMRLTVHGRTMLAEGDRVRNTLTAADTGRSMTATWERQTDGGAWIRWMDLTFQRIR
ncbi:DUF1579 family protein [Jidongwangia harbinensis]|uniref:DUF1579 family protein n=1 Tax=Jidongwangia harbinensis TaxID=2878561 RepID=UPI001CD9C95A|nr:DUF1579 family protein [Jidongwangia harbinensis]MCA2213095.1 DUF1579 domain-containing protein [Jidongwangia harbinensis]